MANFALECQRELANFTDPKQRPMLMRYGLHCGKVVAGRLAIANSPFDVWGDDVNVAARMEQNSSKGI